MTLDEFIAEQKDHLERFEKYWREQAAINSVTHVESYPMVMDKGDWDEQLHIFADSSDSWDDVFADAEHLETEEGEDSWDD